MRPRTVTIHPRLMPNDAASCRIPGERHGRRGEAGEVSRLAGGLARTCGSSGVRPGSERGAEADQSLAGEEGRCAGADDDRDRVIAGGAVLGSPRDASVTGRPVTASSTRSTPSAQLANTRSPRMAFAVNENDGSRWRQTGSPVHGSRAAATQVPASRCRSRGRTPVDRPSRQGRPQARWSARRRLRRPSGMWRG